MNASVESSVTVWKEMHPSLGYWVDVGVKSSSGIMAGLVSECDCREFYLYYGNVVSGLVQS